MVIPWIFDTECHPNCFIAIFYSPKLNSYREFGFWKDGNIDDRAALIKFLLDPKNILIGYNTVKYDGVLLQAIINDPGITHEELKELSDRSVMSKWPLISVKDRIFQEFCLLKIWHYDNRARMTGLKHLEFVYRMPSIKDLPYDHNSPIKSLTAYTNLVKYCKHDIQATLKHYLNSKTKIKGRLQVMKKFGLDVRNASDSSMGIQIILYNLAKKMGIEMSDLKGKYTNHEKIHIKDVPMPIFRKRAGICRHLIEDHFDPITLYGEKDPETGRQVFNFKGHNYEFEWRGIHITVGFGGIHGCIKKGVYDSNEEMVIKSSDVTSQYPNAVINWKIFPAHLGPLFLEVYDKDVYQERGKYPKKTHFTMNMTYKLACNAAVGKFKDKYSELYDPVCNLKVTVNCQLAIMALAEELLDRIPGSKILMLNTDGLEVMIPRSQEDKWARICAKWERITKFGLEHVDYTRMVIYNVNAYIAVDTAGNVKRKNFFRTYEDYIKREDFHNDPSATVIAQALNDYFVKGIPIEDTVNGCNDIHEFVFGVKKTKRFNYVIISAQPDRTVKLKKFKERVFRYYVSDADKAGNLFKLWDDGRLTAVNKGDLIVGCPSLRSPRAELYKDLNRQYYIDHCHKLRSEIEFGI